MKSGRTYFVINNGQVLDDRVMAFTRQGTDTDYMFFINRTGEEFVFSNVTDYFFNFGRFEPFYGEYKNDTLIVPPYGYSILKAKYTGKF